MVVLFSVSPTASLAGGCQPLSQQGQLLGKVVLLPSRDVGKTGHL